jgi:hypothetical protein
MAFVAGRGAHLVELARCYSCIIKTKLFRGFAGRVGRVRPVLEAQYQHLTRKCRNRGRARGEINPGLSPAQCVHESFQASELA